METIDIDEDDMFTQSEAGCTQYELKRSVIEACNKFLKESGDPFAGHDMRGIVNASHKLSKQRRNKTNAQR